MNRLLSILLLVVCAGTCCLAADDPKAAIAAATKSYVAQTSGMSGVKVTVEKVDGNYARAKVAPAQAGETDPAWVFLKNKNGTWTGLTMGTYFEPEDYRTFGIPATLWVK